MTSSKTTVFRGLATASVAAVMLVTVSVGAGAQTALEQTSEKLVRPMPAPSDVAAPPADAVTAASGLATKVITPGTGTAKPSPQDTVTVHYTGWTTNGAMFDSSYARGKTSTFSLTRVIPGWSEALQLMVVGEKRRAWIPEALAYKGAEGKPKGMLVFDVELVGFTEAPVTPADVAAAPADAQKTKSGLAYKVLRPGTGKEKPKSSTTVTVHYSGWTTDGKMFDSSVVNGKPATFGLNQVIKGWTEGVQLMVEGEKTRFWIPSKLAYDGAPDRPQGMLVFDVELIKIEK
jgi:peptidylprolyl isomerase